MKSIFKILFLFNFLFFSAFSISAQKVTTSPYSRYGLGELQSRSYSQNFAMGGLSTAIQNDTLTPYFINGGNPASYTSNRISSFELAIMSNTLQTINSTENQLTNATTLGYVAFVLPIITDKWGMGFGVKPFTGTGFNVTDSKKVDSIGTINYTYSGAGGISQLYWGNGFRIKNISIGGNLSYLFGRIENTSRIIMPSASNYLNTRINKTTSFGSFYLDYGFQITTNVDSIRVHQHLNSDPVTYRKLSVPVKIIFGGKFALATDLKAKANTIAQTYVPDAFGGAYWRDTVQNTTGVKESFHLPVQFSVGITIKKGDRLMTGIEYEVQQQSGYMMNPINGTLRIGAQFLPASKSLTGNASYLKTVYYRVGARYTDSYLQLKNIVLKEYAISMGVSLPVGRHKHQYAFSLLNIGVEAGQRGTISEDLIKENFVKVMLGVTLNDRWFIKPKFD